jgi:hypothetical protein
MDFTRLLAVSDQVRAVFFDSGSVKIETNCARIRQYIGTTFCDAEKCDEAYAQVSAAGWGMPDSPSWCGKGYRVWDLIRDEKIASRYTRNGRAFTDNAVPAVSRAKIEDMLGHGMTGPAMRQIMVVYDKTHVRKLPGDWHKRVTSDIHIGAWTPAPALVAWLETR